MSGGRDTLVVVLEHDRVVLPAQQITLPGGVDDARDVAAAIRSAVPTARRLVLVVGLGLLELAAPELPPLDDEACTGLLRRDADRYFPLADTMAVQWRPPFALGAPDALLQRWIAALAPFASVDAVVSIVDVVLQAAASGTLTVRDGGGSTVQVDAGPGERGLITVGRQAGDVVLRDVRRAPWPTDAPRDDSATTDRTPPVELAPAVIVAAARALAGGSLARMLLPHAHGMQLAGARRRRWVASAALLASSLGVLVWSADRSRERTLASAEQALAEAERASAPARGAAARLASTRLERATLGAADGPDPGAVLARLGRVLPRDAFVERLEWDGALWRIDGSATNAPAIVPRLDADSAFTDVRIVAASMRFTDRGRQRESFAIAFRARPVPR